MAGGVEGEEVEGWREGRREEGWKEEEGEGGVEKRRKEEMGIVLEKEHLSPLSLSQGGSFRRETAALREGTTNGCLQSAPLPAAAVTRVPAGEQRHLGATVGGEEGMETGQTPEPLCEPPPTLLTVK